jgi:hypothetical protein
LIFAVILKSAETARVLEYCLNRIFVFFDSLYIQVIQGFIHDDHEDLINKHVMMIRPTIFLSRSQYELSRMCSVFSFVKFLSCMDNATSYQTAGCGVIDNVSNHFLVKTMFCKNQVGRVI